MIILHIIIYKSNHKPFLVHELNDTYDYLSLKTTNDITTNQNLKGCQLRTIEIVLSHILFKNTRILHCWTKI